MNNSNKKRKNRSSIVRIIISNFNDTEIKELKVLYTKQGGVDTFKVETAIEDSKLLFKSVHARRREKKERFEIEKFQDNFVVKKYLNQKLLRHYKVTAYLLPENNKIFEVEVEDLKEENKDLPKKNTISKSQRKFLDMELLEKYSEIASYKQEEPKKNIDSQKIYKINKFLSYRSNMLIYFQFINDFLVKGLKNREEKDLGEIWKAIDKDEIINEDYLNAVSKIFYSYLVEELENRNNRIEKLNKKIEQFNSDSKNKHKNKDLIPNFSTDMIKIEETKEDIKKIIYLFADFRHKIMHYNYSFFEGLFSGENSDIDKSGMKLNEILNLNFFKQLKIIKDLKEENKTNYLDDDSQIMVLGKQKNAKSVYKLYNKICNRKNGFNNFINSLFVEDGIEDPDFKELITEHFDNRIEFLKKLKKDSPKHKSIKSIKKELEDKEKIKKLIGVPYVWDIHQSRKYKDLYIERKEIVAHNSKLISSGINATNKTAITKNNEKLLNLKKQMEEITKLNSLMRLEYKLQVAFAFLYCNYSYVIPLKKRNKDTGKMESENHRVINLKKFMDDKNNDFYSSKLDKINEFISFKESYISAPYNNFFDEKLPINFDIGKLVGEGHIKETNFILYDNVENNLSKFYVLMYLLIPVELRGDFLGFAKKHYYDIKNVDFVEYDTDETQDKFFQNLRLFEKNSKKFEIIKYNLIEFNNLKDDFEKIYQKFKLNTDEINVIQYTGTKEKHLFDKNIILPLMKYYQMIFKLLNDIEIHALFRYKEILNEKKEENKKEISFQEAIIELSNEDGIFKFSDLMKKAKLGNKADLFKIRNDIAHLDYHNIFIHCFLDEPLLKNAQEYEKDSLNKFSISERVDKIIARVKERGLIKKSLGTNFINDFYMKKEQFLFNQRQTSLDNISSPERKRKLDKEEELLRFYGIYDKNQSKILKKYKDLLKELDKEILNPKFLKSIGKMEILLKGKQNLKIIDMKLSEQQDYMDNIKGKLKRDASDLLGIYKKYVIFDIKKKLINLFTKGERRELKVILMHQSEDLTWSKEEIILEFFEKNDKNWNDDEFEARYVLQPNLEMFNNTGIKTNYDENSGIFSFENENNPKENKRLVQKNIKGNYIEKVTLPIANIEN